MLVYFFKNAQTHVWIESRWYLQFTEIVCNHRLSNQAGQAKCEVVYPNGEAALADVKLTMSMNEVKAAMLLRQLVFFG